MTKLYTYMVAINTNGQWRTTIHAEKQFSRDAESVARGLLEQWVIRQRRVPGGARMVVHGRRRTGRHNAGRHSAGGRRTTGRFRVWRRGNAQDSDALVRVLVYSGRLAAATPAPTDLPAASAYLLRVDTGQLIRAA